MPKAVKEEQPYDPPGRVALTINDLEGRKLCLEYDLEHSSGQIRLGDETFLVTSVEALLFAGFFDGPARLARRELR